MAFLEIASCFLRYELRVSSLFILLWLCFFKVNQNYGKSKVSLYVYDGLILLKNKLLNLKTKNNK